MTLLDGGVTVDARGNRVVKLNRTGWVCKDHWRVRRYPKALTDRLKRELTREYWGPRQTTLFDSYIGAPDPKHYDTEG